MKPRTRRDILKRTTQALLGYCAWSTVGSSRRMNAEAKRAPQLPVSLRDVHLKLIGKDDCWSAVRAVGADGVEVVVDDDLELPELSRWSRRYSLRTDEEIQTVARDSKAAGVRITALCMDNRLDARPEVEVRWISQVARAAKQLEVPAVRIDLAPRKLEGKEFLEFCVSTLKQVLRETRDTDVRFGVENHGKTTNDSRFLDELFEVIEDPRLGLTLDTGNFYWYGYPLSELYPLYEKYASRVVHTHLKTIKYPTVSRNKRRSPGWEYAKYCCPIYEGDVDFEHVLKILRAAGYSSDLCVENESLMKFPSEERRRVLAREIDQIRWLQSF